MAAGAGGAGRGTKLHDLLHMCLFNTRIEGLKINKQIGIHLPYRMMASFIRRYLSFVAGSNWSLMLSVLCDLLVDYYFVLLNSGP